MTLTAELRDLLGHDRVLTEPLERWVYGVDSGVVRGDPQLVAFPETTAEVASIVRLARHYRTPIVARGAGTGSRASLMGVSDDGGIPRPYHVNPFKTSSNQLPYYPVLPLSVS